MPSWLESTTSTLLPCLLFFPRSTKPSRRCRIAPRLNTKSREGAESAIVAMWGSTYAGQGHCVRRDEHVCFDVAASLCRVKTVPINDCRRPGELRG